MAKVEKLTTKLKSAIKRWPSITKLARTTSRNVSVAAVNDTMSNTDENYHVSKPELHTVFVGKTRRRYLISSDVVGHPLFRELVDKSSTTGEGDDGVVVVVSCEVVLFEHMLWMLENAASLLGSMEELVEFYTC